MISISNSLESLIQHFQIKSDGEKSHVVEHVWKLNNQTLASVEVNLTQRSFKLLSLEASPSLLPRLTSCVIQTLRLSLDYKENEKLTGLHELLLATSDKTVLKEILLEWLRSGGNPHVKFNEESLICRCFDYEDLELLKAFTECGGKLFLSAWKKDSESVVYRTILSLLAIYYKRIDIIQFLVDKGYDFTEAGSIDVDGILFDEITPLNLAFRLKNFAIVKVLIEGDVKAEDPKYLVDAVSRNQIEIVKLLLKKGANPSGVALYWAISEQKLDIVLCLLEAGADAKQKDCLKRAVTGDFREGVELLIAKGADPNAEDVLRMAAKKSSIEVVRLLFNAGATSRYWAYSDAINRGDLEIIQCFIDHGADPNDLNQKAVQRSDLSLLRLVIKAGANLNRLLYNAVDEENKEAVQLILEAGGDPSDEKILLSAIKTLNHDLIKLLVQRGAHLTSLGLFYLFNWYSGNNLFLRLEAIMHYLPPIDTKYLDLKSMNCFLEALARKKNREVLDIFTLIAHAQLLINLAHRFGVLMEGLVDTGFEYAFKMDLEGNVGTIQEHKETDLFERHTKVDFNRSLKDSALAFFKKNPQLANPQILQLLNQLCEPHGLLGLNQAESLLEIHKSGQDIFIDGHWPQHYVKIGLINGCLVLFNRGAYREEDVKPGIHFYYFEDLGKMTGELLMQIQTSPELLLQVEGRKSLGLKEEFNTLLGKEQPGGTCTWTNAKLGMKFLFLATMSDTQERGKAFLDKIVSHYKTAIPLYKQWSKFDRDYAIEEALSFYEKHPEMQPYIPLLLCVLANHKGSFEKITPFLLKQKITFEHFSVRHKKGKTPFHYLTSVASFEAFKEVMQKVENKKLEDFLPLLNAKCEQGVPPLDSMMVLKKIALVKAMRLCGATNSPTFLKIVYKQFCRSDDIESLMIGISNGVHFGGVDDEDKTGLHYAIEYKSNKIVSYFLENMKECFFIQKTDVEAYILHAQQHSNLEAVELLKNL